MIAAASSPTASPVARAPFHVMTKPAGSACNLACTYCFYLEKAQLYPGSRSRMTPELLEHYIRDYIVAQPGNAVSFAWQGGEPTLLGVDYYRTVVALQQRHAGGKTIHNALQTNGVLLDDAWGRFLAEHRFLVGISIDGPRHLHDAYRVDRHEEPTFDRVMRGIEVLKRHGVEFNTLTTVHRQNARHALEVYRFLRRIGSGFIQFIPIVEREPSATTPDGLWLAAPPHPGDGATETRVTPWTVRPVEYGNFLCAVFDEWVRHDVGRIFVQQFDAALGSWSGQGAGICVFSPECGRALAVEHNGDVYRCDHYVYPAHRLGNLRSEALTDLVDSPAQRAFGRAKRETLPRYCRECPVRFACHGECPKHRFLRTPDGEPGLNYLCAGYRKFFQHIDPAMRAMTALLLNGRAPAEIMRAR